ncbi:MAG TPA: penicillin acylase family protein, partial [Acetobacteraceae bacterium]|nr:penicillin acylase family protein [Acetobacteraceae bacterium]
SAAVTATYDGDGVPWIRAANEQDAATALGYVHARDRMFQMDLMRRAASGRLAELVGPAALPLDKQMRVLGLSRLAEGDVAAQTPETRALLEAYSAGVNAWIAQRGRFAALEFLYFGAPEPWRPSDSLLWGRTMSLWLSTNYRTELTRQALSEKVPTRLLEQLWPPHTAPPPPQASLTGADQRFAAQSDQRPTQEGGQTSVHLSAATAAAVLAALPAFPAPFTLPSSASDAWAVDGRWTDTGAPMLAGDPHLSFEFPSLWYLVRIETPGRTLVGATAPGAPFLVLGHNGSIAWTFTTTGADTQDVYLEPPDVTLTTHQERIKVRGQPDTNLTVRTTRHGPVISDLMSGNHPIMAVAMENLMPWDTGASGLLALDHADTVEEAGKAAPLIMSPVQNLMVADRTKIGLFVTGRVPIRRSGDGWAPVPGNSAMAMKTPGPTREPSAQTAGQRSPTPSASTAIPSAHALPAPDAAEPGSGAPQSLTTAENGEPAQANDDPYGWIGFASGQALPHIVTPASGRLVNANEPVWPPDFPVFMSRDTFSDWRARRIRTLLTGTSQPGSEPESAPKHSTSDFAAMQVDTVSTYAAALLPTLRVVPGAPQVLRDWDGAMTQNAPQPLIFSAWMQAFQSDVLAKAGIPYWAGSPIFEFVPFVLSPEGASWCGGDCAPLLKSTLDSTMASLASRFGSDPAAWRWGAVHQAVFAHPLLRSIPVLGTLTEARIAMPGDGTTLDCGGTDEALAAVHGASFRGVYDLADLDRSLFMMAPGQSGNPLSRHARDFLTRWRNGAMVMLPPQPVETSGIIRLEP